MNIQEKTQLFNLLKTASDNFYGYSSPEFKYDPIFTDDEVIAETNTEAEVKEESTQVEIPEEKPATGISLESIAQKIHDCKRCKLCNGRKNTVPGMGVEQPVALIVGEGPGEEEDNQGLPFVGPAGQLLDKMLAAIQLDRRTNCYIANTVKCRPPYNRDPEKEEADACRSFLDAQIHVLKPKMILALGKVAVRNMLNIQGEFALNKYRLQVFDYNGIPLVVTYHPSALLRNIEFKKPAWDDLKFFKSKLEELSPEYKQSCSK